MNAIRQPIIVVMGHVDAGKTSLLDRIRGTTVAAREAGAITQHIGATEVPLSIIEGTAGALLEQYGFALKIPGLLFIDTPGHEAFTHLRERGGSIADLCVLVVDAIKGLQEQSFEALNILRTFKTPFIVAMNKIDNIAGWKTANASFTSNLAQQNAYALEALDKKLYEIVGQLHAKGFNSERFDRCENFTQQIPIIPVCSKSGEGIAEVLVFLSGLSQKFLENELALHVKGAARGSVLEVKEEKGLGTTIDIILYDGMLHVKEEIAVLGRAGVITTKVRAILKPKPLEQMGSGEKFFNVLEAHAASGIKISAPLLENAIAGSPFIAVSSEKDIEELKKESKEIKIESDVAGVVIKADTLGSLEAMVKLLQGAGLKIRFADLGTISKNDVMCALAVRENDAEKAVIFAFNVNAMPVALEEAEKKGIKIFSGNVIYRLIEEYSQWIELFREQARKLKETELIYPFAFKILPGNIFRNSKPAVAGIHVISGKIKPGVEIINGNGEIVGRVESLQSEGKTLHEAREGEEVAIAISGATIGRQINENETLYSAITQKGLAKILQNADMFSSGEIELAKKLFGMQQKNSENGN